jgi:branched-chain amino acid transport system ATP-binding protein
MTETLSVAPLLQLKHVVKRFGGLVATHDVSFDIQEGEFVFIIGPNGAGKTTLFNLISGYVTADSGEILYRGQNLVGMKPYQTTRLGIGRTFQIVKPLPSLTVRENVMLGSFLHYPKRAEASRKADEVLEFLGLARRADQLASGLPLAQRKLLEVARALATGAKLLLLDEVMAGLNPTESSEVVALLRRLKDFGVTAVGGVEHIMRVVMALATRVVVIDQGAKLAEGPPQTVVHDPRVVEAYLGSKYSQGEAKP